MANAPEYLPTPAQIARRCLDLQLAKDMPEGQGNVVDVLRERLSLSERERIADDVVENERVGRVEREMDDAFAALCWPIQDIGLPANVSQALVDRNIILPKQLATELTEADFLTLPGPAPVTLRRALRELKALGWTFVPGEAIDDEPVPDRSVAMADVWRQRIERLASDVSGRKLNDEEDLSHGAHTVGWAAKRRVKDALQAVCSSCLGKRPKRAKCRKCKGAGRVGKIGTVTAAVKALGFDMAARGTAKVIRYVEMVRAELQGGSR